MIKAITIILTTFPSVVNNLSLVHQTQTAQYNVNQSIEAFNQIAIDYQLSEIEKEQWKYIINKESGFNTLATNQQTGAYGLGQALPKEKMASAGADYLTNPYTQLKWCYGYMLQRYGSISNAYSFWIANGWY